MSREIDNQIVKMEFDNKKFEKNVNTSLNTIQKLKKALNFDEQAKTIKELERAANHLTLDDIGATLDKLSDRFSSFGIAGMTVIQDLTRAAEKAGLKILNVLQAPLRQIETGGWSRASKIKNAEFTMRGLNIVGDKLVEIKNNINEAVSGTAYGYESAANAAAQFAASNVKIGDDMLKALRAISGVAAMTNSSYDEIAGIFTTIAGNGKVMTQQLRQLSFRGMNASATLAKAMHTSESAINEMVSDGKISFADFAEAMDEAFGEHATKANETFKGALDNMKASLSRVGADFADPLMDAERDIFNATRVILNSLRKSTSAYDTFKEKFDEANKSFRELTPSESINMELMRRAMNETKLSIADNIDFYMKQYEMSKKASESYKKQYDELKALKNPTQEQIAETKGLTKALKDQDEVLENIKKNIKRSVREDAQGSALLGDEVMKLLDKTRIKIDPKAFTDPKALDETIKKLKETNKLTESEQILLRRLKSIASDSTYYLTDNATKALAEIDRLSAKYTKYEERIKELQGKPILSKSEAKELDGLYKSMDKIEGKLDKLETKAYDNMVINRTNSVARLVETYKETLGGIRQEVLSFLNNPKLIYSINNVVDSLQGFLQAINQLAQPFKNAWRSIFPTNEADILYNITEKFREFSQSLRLSKEGADQFESITRGVFATLRILGNVIGDVLNLLKTVGIPVLKALTPILSWAGEVLVTIEWRVRQASAAIKFTLGYFSDLIKNSTTFQNVLSGLSKVIGIVLGTFEALAKTVGVVLVGAVLLALTALDKLAGKIGPVVEFLAPIAKALISLFGSVLSLVGKVLTTVLTPIGKFITAIRETNQNVGKLGSKTLTPLQKFAVVVRSVASAVRDFVANGITKLSDAISNFSPIDVLTNVIDKIKYILEGLKSGALSLPQVIGGGIEKVFDGIAFAVGKAADAVKAFFGEFTKASNVMAKGNGTLKDTKEQTTGIVGKLSEFFKSIGNSSAIKAFGDGLDFIKEKLSGFFSAITPTKVFAVAFTGSLIMMTVAIYKLIKAAEDFVTFSTQIPVAITDLLGSVKGFFKALTERVQPAKKASTQFKEIAEAIAIIAGSIYVLGNMDRKKLMQAGAAVGQILVVIAAFNLAMSLMTKIPSNNLRMVAEYQTTMQSLLRLAATIALVGIALRVIAKSNYGPGIEMLGKVILAIGALAGVAAVVAAFSRYDKGVKTGSLAILAFAGALYTVAKTFEKLQGIPVKEMYTTFAGLIPVIATLGALAWAVGHVTFTGGLGMILTITAIYMAVPLLKKISKVNFKAASDALMGFALVIGALAVIAGAISIIFKQNIFEAFESFGKGMLKVAEAMIILTGVVFLLGSMRKSTLIRGITSLGFIAAFVAGLEAISFLTVGNDMKNFGKGLIAASVAMTIMSGLVAILGGMDKTELWNGISAVGALTIMVGLLEGLSALTKGVDSKGMGLLIALTVDILALAATLVLLSNIPWQKSLAAMGAMSGTLIGFGVMCALMMKNVDAYKGSVGKFLYLIELAGIIAVVAVALYQLSSKDWRSLLGAMGAMSLTLISVGLMLCEITLALENVKLDQVGKSLLMMVGAAGIIFLFSMVLYELAARPWDQMLAGGAAMGACLLAFGVAMNQVLKGAKDFATDNVGTLLVMVEMAGIIFALSIALYELAARPWNQMLAAGAAMSGALLAFSGACYIVFTAAKNFRGGKAKFAILAEMALVVVAIGAALWLASQNDWKQILAAMGAISLCLLAYAGACAIIMTVSRGLPSDPLTVMVPLITMAGAMAIMAYALFQLSKHDWKSIAAACLGLSAVLLVLSGAIAILGILPVTAGIQAALNLASFVGIIFGIMAGVGALIKNTIGFDEVASWFEGLGQVVGSLVKGFTDAATENLEDIADRLSAFASKSADFFNLMKDIKESGSIDAVDAVVAAVLTLAKAEFVDALNIFGKLGEVVSGKSQLDILGENLASMADVIVEFNNTMSSIPDIDTLIKQISTMEKLFAAMGKLPAAVTTYTNAEGYDVVATVDFEAFGHGLVMLGGALISFAGTVKDLDTKAVEKAEIAMGMINAFSHEIPNEGGLIGLLAGDNSMEEFAKGLIPLGAGLMRFSMSSKFIDNNGVKKAEIAMGMISAFAKEIPNSGGLIGRIAGNNDLDDFGETLPSLGKNLSEFSKNTYGIDVTRGQAISKIITDLASAVQTINTSGMDTLRTFAENLPTAASNLKTFFATLEDNDIYDTNKVRNFCSSIRALSNLSKDIDTKVSDSFNTFANSLENLNRTGLNATSAETLRAFKATLDLTIEEIKGKQEAFLSAGQESVQNYIDGMDDEIGLVVTEAANVAIQAKRKLEDWYETFRTVGKYSAKAYARGLRDSEATKEIESAATSLSELAGSKATVSDVSSSTTSSIMLSVTRSLNAINDKAADFGAAARSIMDNFNGGIDGKIEPGLTGIATKVNSTLNNIFKSTTWYDKYKASGEGASKNFAAGITSTTAVSKVEESARSIANKAYNAMKNELDEHSPSKATEKLGNYYSEGFAIGIKNSMKSSLEAAATLAAKTIKMTKAESDSDEAVKAGGTISTGYAMGIKQSAGKAVKEAAKMGTDSVKSIKDVTHDPTIFGVEVSLDTFAAGKAFGAGYEKGIASFNSAVKKAAAVLGISAESGLDIGNIANKISEMMGGSNYIAGLLKIVNGVGNKLEKKMTKSLFGDFFEDAKKEIDKATEDLDSQIGNAKSTGDKKKKGGGKSKKDTWTNDDLIKTISAWKSITNRFNVKYDEFNANLLKKGKVTSKYMASSMHNNDLRKAVLSMNESTWKSLNAAIKKEVNSKGVKVGTDAYAKIARRHARGYVETFEAEFNEFTSGLTERLADPAVLKKLEKLKTKRSDQKKIVKDQNKILNDKNSTEKQKKAAEKAKKEAEKEIETLDKRIKKVKNQRDELVNVVTSIPGVTKAYIKNYTDPTKWAAKNVSHIAKSLREENTKKQNQSYKDAKSKREKYEEKLDRIWEKKKKQQTILNDKKSTKAQKEAAKAKIKTYNKQEKDTQNKIEKIDAKIAKSPKGQATSIIGNFAKKLYEKSDDYKKAKKEEKKLAKEYADLIKKADKERAVVNDKNASAKRKKQAEERMLQYEKEAKEAQKNLKKVEKSIEKGPEKAFKKLKKEIKSAVKEFVSFSNISFEKVLSPFDAVSKSTALQAQSYDIFTRSLVSVEEATKAATDSFGLLNTSVDTGINLLERFEKVGSMSVRRLMKNAESQLKAYEEFTAGLASLKAKGLDDAMIEQLRSQGTSALSQIRGFLKMSSSDIATYNAMVRKEEAYKAKETEAEMQRTVDKYEEHSKNLEKLAARLPEDTKDKLMREIKSQGISGYDFVKTLLYMDDTTLNSVSKMYSESLSNAVQQAVDQVDLANQGKTFKEQIEETVLNFEDQQTKIKQLQDELGLSDLLAEKLKGMSYNEFKAYYEEFASYNKEGMDYVNKQYEKSLYNGKDPASVWIENMTKTNDLYDAWTKVEKRLVRKLGNGDSEAGYRDPLYQAIRDMGWETGSEYAEAFLNASAEDQNRIVSEFKRQQDANSKAIIDDLNYRIRMIRQWRDDLETLSNRGISDTLMGELVSAGPDDYEKVHALVEMSSEDLDTFDEKYQKAMKLPEKVANSVLESYATLGMNNSQAVADAMKSDESKKKVNDAATEVMNGAAETTAEVAKSEENKKKTTTAVNETVKAAAAESKTYAKKEFKAVGKAIIKGLKTYCDTDKGKAIGKNVGEGLSEGIGSTASLVKSAAKKLARKAYNAMKEELDVNSPSKATEELGKFFDLGFVQGLERYQHLITNAADDISSNVLDQFGNISDDISNDTTLSPVIHPTLDVSGVSDDIYSIAAAMDISRDIVVKLDKNSNKDVVDAIDSLQSDFGDKVAALSSAMESMQIYLDSGVLVGELAGPMDSAMGKMMANRRRGM